MGTLMKNGIPYGGGGGGDNSKTVTYEQYKNLSEAEKNSDTTYYVPDYPEETVEIVDNLESTDTDKALSANMGRELKEDKVSKSEFNNVMPVTSDFGTVSGGYVKIGKVVTVNINIRLTSNLTSNSSNVVSGLPNTAVSYAQLPCLNVSSSVGLTAYILYGHVRILASNATHISSGQTITISGSYIAA